MKNTCLITTILFASPLLINSASGSVLYDNGPISTTVNAWRINSGVAVTNSFTLTAAATLTGVNFGVWTLGGDLPVSVQWGISTLPNYTNAAGGGGTPVASLTNTLVCTGCASTDDAYTSSFSLPNIALAAGTYWLSFQNAVATHGDGLYWDINNGPSQTFVNTVGSVQNLIGTGSNSNSFQILGTVTPTVAGTETPEPASGTLLFSSLLLLGGGCAVRRRICG